MLRDLVDYQLQYAFLPYEKYQVAFRKRKIKELLAKYNHSILLEVGCGFESIFLDIDSYNKLVVVEPGEVFFKKSLKDLAENKHVAPKVELINTLLEEAHDLLKDYHFDFVIASSILHEIVDHKSFLKSIYNVCSDDTVIHFNVPNAKSFHRLLGLEMRLIDNEYSRSESNIRFQQHTVFDLELLKKTMKENNFEVIESGFYSFKPFTHSQMQNMIDAGLFTEQMLNGFYQMEKHLPELCSEIFVNVKKINRP